MGKWCLHASSFIFDQIVIKVAGNQDRHKSSDEFDFGPLVSMAHLYVFEMRFDLSTLDSGERSLPFGLLVHLLGKTFSREFMKSLLFTVSENMNSNFRNLSYFIRKHIRKKELFLRLAEFTKTY